MKSAIVLGAGGFIGSHMVKRLKAEGYWVRGVDIKYPDFSPSQADDFVIFDLREPNNYQIFVHQQEKYKTEHFDECYQLAADMGGAGYVFVGTHDADIIHNSAQINLNVCETLAETKTKVFFSSSACMYPQELQEGQKFLGNIPNGIGGNGDVFMNQFGLKESDAYPANPDSDYGWEKLMSERLYLAYHRNYGLDIRIARFHNIYGPEGTYQGGKEKAPAAICRKVIEAKDSIEIWGDGLQTRSFLYIDDCIDAVRLLMASDFKEPINIGSEEMVSIDRLAELVISFEKKPITIKHIEGPTGVRGRNSDNTLIRQVLKWEPQTPLIIGVSNLYAWLKYGGFAG